MQTINILYELTLSSKPILTVGALGLREISASSGSNYL